MCGIAGISRSTKHARAHVSEMLDHLGHRGPDERGCEEIGNHILGHTRLSIVDVEGGRQPLLNEDGSLAAVVNGEIYNHDELRRMLPAHDFRTRSDSEVVVHLYERFGPEFVAMLNGMFAIAIVGPDTVYVARDPLGIKPLYLGWDGDTLLFASEAKALRSRVERVQELPAGSYFHSECGVREYFDLERFVEAAPGHRCDADTIREMLTLAVRRRLMADVEVGVFLSGGLDSSLIAALAARDLPRVHTFGVGTQDSEDLQAAAAVAAHIGSRHHTRRYTAQDVVDALPEVIYHLESYDPALVRSAIANFFLAELTAEHVKVALSGEGADELFAGYDYLRKFERPARLQTELVAISAALHNTNLQRCDRMSMAHSLEARVPFLDLDMVQTAFAVPPEAKLHATGRPAKAVLREAFPDLLPDRIRNRKKAKFSAGAGSAEFLKDYADATVTDADLAGSRAATDRPDLTREEALNRYVYFDVLGADMPEDHFGRSRSL